MPTDVLTLMRCNPRRATIAHKDHQTEILSMVNNTAEYRFRQRVQQGRLKFFKLSPEAERLEIMAEKKKRHAPALFHFSSRKSHNRLTHALNGNTPASAAAGGPQEEKPTSVHFLSG